jgi:beta-galactosidase
MRMRSSNLLTIAMTLFLLYAIFPLVWLVISSTKTTSDLFATYGLWFGHEFALFSNIRQTLTHGNGQYLRWLANTLVYSVVSAVGAACLATFAGYGFAKYTFRGRGALLGIVLGTIMVPVTALAIPTYLLFSKVSLVNTPWAVILPSLVSPFGFFLMWVYTRDAVSDSILDAARIDGAGELTIFFKVSVRSLAPGFVTVLLFTLVATWNNYFLPLIMLNDSRYYPITVGLSSWASQAVGGTGANAGLLALVVTGSLLSVIPLIVVFILLQRYWQSGLSTGAVKELPSRGVAPPMVHLPPKVLFGAAYYHEYQRGEHLETDLDLMADAGFSVIRVGESVWSTWEPENGQFNLDWLQPVLDGAQQRGMSVILGTPTYAVPPWLARQYPEIAGERSSGRPIPWGARQEMDFTHPAFLFHAERVIRRIIGRYAGHPAIIGYQVDNEPGFELLHNRGVFQRFTDHLRRTYGSVERLNEEWGLVYWSHRLSTWADLWLPDGNAQPQYDLAWRRFQAQLTTEFIAWQAEIVREYATPAAFITTCIAYDRPAFDDAQLTESLDVTTGNAYYVMQDGLAVPDTRTVTQTWTTDGTWALYLSADRMYSSRQEPFLVTETNASSIGFSWDTRPAYDGQWRQVAWALVARGARMIGYWHWHTLHHGTETYWGGILPHSGRPGRTYQQISQLGGEFARAGELVAGLVPDADIAMVFDMPSRWIMQKYPALCHTDGTPDERAYQGLFEPFYRGAFDAGLQVRILHTSQLPSVEDAVRDYPVLAAPGLYIAGDETLDWLRDYALAGGHLVLGPRTGYADTEARARQDRMPARLSETAGVWYEEFSNLREPVEVISAGVEGFTLPPGSEATRWVDGLYADALLADGGAVLARYRHPHFGRWPAVTTRAAGKGRVTYVGTVPGLSFAQAVLRWACEGGRGAWTGLPASVTSSGATAADGRRLRFLHNWSWAAATVAAATDCTDVLSGKRVERGDIIELAAWDVRVLAEE